jgi:hypothetical protein
MFFRGRPLRQKALEHASRHPDHAFVRADDYAELRPAAPHSSGCLRGRRRNGASKPATYSETRFERVAGRKLRRRQLTEDDNVEIRERDLHEGSDVSPGGRAGAWR